MQGNAEFRGDFKAGWRPAVELCHVPLSLVPFGGNQGFGSA